MKKNEKRNLISLAAGELSTEHETHEFLKNIGDEDYHFIVEENTKEISRHDKLFFTLDLFKCVNALEIDADMKNQLFAYHMQEAMMIARDTGKLEDFETITDKALDSIITQKLRLEKKGEY